jgi:hypothetical protein
MPATKIRTRTAAARVVGSVWVFVHTKENPSDDEWATLMKQYTDPNQKNVRTLVYSEGGAPNAGQRAKLKQLQGGVAVPIAVLTPSQMVRAAVTAIGWFNDRVRSFPADQMEEALNFLDIPLGQRETLKSAMAELREEVLGNRPKRAEP